MRSLYSIFSDCTGVATDSRQVGFGQLFFALHGDNFDGNAYAAAALERGAMAAVVDRAEVAVDERYIVVDDTLTALQELAAEHRRRLAIPILAITGSNGKTTTKELISRVLSTKYRVAVTRGNLNNHIGVPLTLLAMSADTEFGVVEMGANHRGEIAALCHIAQPDYGLITNIGLAHLEGFGGAEGVRAGKGELFDYLAETGGVAVYQSDNHVINGMIAERHTLKREGYKSENYAYRQTPDGLDVDLGGVVVHSHLIGTYNRYNIAAAVGVGHFFGIVDENIAVAIESYVPDNNRSQVMDTGRNRLYLDAYNANPSSMEASLANFRDNIDSGCKVAILGDMLELGEFSASEHRRILDVAATCSLSAIYLVGEHFTEADSACLYHHFASVDELCKYLDVNPISSAAVLLKGSRGTRLEKVVELL